MIQRVENAQMEVQNVKGYSMLQPKIIKWVHIVKIHLTGIKRCHVAVHTEDFH